MSSKADVCVQGGGAVGLAAALACARAGLTVALRAVPPAAGATGDLRAYALNAASVALLQQLRVWEGLAAAARTPVYDMRVRGDEGAAALHFSAWQQGVSELAFIVDAAALESALWQAVRFAPHVRVLGTHEEAAAALTVLAEGRDSASRSRLGVRWIEQPYQHSAVAARLRSTTPHEGVAHQWFRSPDVLALLPFDVPAQGHGFALVWSAPQQRAQELLSLPVTEFEAALNEATAGQAGTLQLLSERAAWPLALAHAEPLCGPGWVLVGDAAHRVHPLSGQGLNLGLADVANLAQVLAARETWRSPGDVLLLRRHARARQGPTQAMGALTDGLLHLFAEPAPWVRALRNRGLAMVDRIAPLKRLLVARALDA